MKIYWSDFYNDYVFKSVFEDAPDDYHTLNTINDIPFVVCFWVFIYEPSPRMKFICEVEDR